VFFLLVSDRMELTKTNIVYVYEVSNDWRKGEHHIIDKKVVRKYCENSFRNRRCHTLSYSLEKLTNSWKPTRSPRIRNMVQNLCEELKRCNYLNWVEGSRKTYFRSCESILALLHEHCLTCLKCIWVHSSQVSQRQAWIALSTNYSLKALYSLSYSFMLGKWSLAQCIISI